MDIKEATGTPGINAGSATEGGDVPTTHHLGGIVETTATVNRAVGGAVLGVKGNAGAVAARLVVVSDPSHLIPTHRTVKAMPRVARVPRAKIKVAKRVAKLKAPPNNNRKAAGGLVRMRTMWTGRAGLASSS